jgi:hypothetical protein
MKGRRTTQLLLGAVLGVAITPLSLAQDLPTPSAPDGSAASAAAADDATAPPAAPAPPAPPPALSPVILSEDPDVVQRFAVNATQVRGMVNRAILKLTSADNIGTAWTRLGVTPDDIVGIKITTMGGPALSTHRPIVQAICDGLQAAGLPLDHIIVWDKFRDDMVRAGYAPVQATDTHVGIASVFPGTGYDRGVFYKNELIGTLIWGDSEFLQHDPDDLLSDPTRGIGAGAPADSLGTGMGEQTSNRSYYAALMSHICTKIINVPVLTDNPYIGIEGCLGSLAIGSVDNNRRFQGSPTYGDPAICEILDPAFVRRKVIVHILDSLVAEYAGGPQFDPQFTQSIGAIYVSRDPVAIDSLVLPRIERWRKLGHIDPIGNTASHIHDAAVYHLGTDDPSRIQRIRIP